MIDLSPRLDPLLRALNPTRWTLRASWRLGQLPRVNLGRDVAREDMFTYFTKERPAMPIDDDYDDYDDLADDHRLAGEVIVTVPAEADRPNPLGNAAKAAGTAWGAASGLLGLLTSFGVLTTAQSTAIETVGNGLPNWLWALGLIVGAVLPAFGALAGAFRTKAKALPEVTPVADARGYDPVSGELRPLVVHNGPVVVEGATGRHAKED